MAPPAGARKVLRKAGQADGQATSGRSLHHVALPGAGGALRYSASPVRACPQRAACLSRGGLIAQACSVAGCTMARSPLGHNALRSASGIGGAPPSSLDHEATAAGWKLAGEGRRWQHSRASITCVPVSQSPATLHATPAANPAVAAANGPHARCSSRERWNTEPPMDVRTPRQLTLLARVGATRNRNAGA
ncbi:hypothetical protein ACCO45_005126 [Purpureocillium lilacinum]|uniref:Uncharacterized protein n=1 Tax=Purpureocillium lilacinum TaxID=33203 RepID=A0ACC4DVU5_PURLI